MDKTQARNAIFGRTLQKRRPVSTPAIPDFAADVVSLSGADRRTLVEQSQGMDLMEQQIAVIIAAYRESGTNEPIFTVGDRDSLMHLPGYVLDELALPALGINGMDTNALETAEGNSVTTSSSSNGSPLPNGSGE